MLSNLRNHWSPPRVLAAGFAVIIMIGTLLLSLPAASQSGERLPLLDALFTATSATCVTGLVVVDTGTYFSIFGQIVILFMLQLGGLGFMTVATWFTLMMKRRISFRERLILKETMNQNTIEGIVRLIGKVFLYSITIESVAALYFAFRWMDEMPLAKAIYFGVFHAVSIFNNGGFELFGDFRGLTLYVNDSGMNIAAMVLVLLGGMGFIVISDVMEYPRTRKLSLHSKVVLTAISVLTLLGALLIFVFERTNPLTLGPMHAGHQIMASFFHSISLRSAGINTVDVGAMRSATLFLMVILMFIGSAPGSTGGGIKVTTFTLLTAALWSTLRGKESVVLFRRRIPSDDIYRALTLAFIGMIVLLGSTLILLTLQPQPFLMVLFEATSAFGTVGLSMGLTRELVPAGEAIIILLMFTGRVGLITLAFALSPGKGKQLYRHPTGDIVIG
ncbi:ATP synthase subunit J [Paenibacillus swuensis]|uniref:ATP synthase subunit J n=1 Tax=Paenibacillus swuensis TaxID=1178515 RepID=A0A172TMB2_9BACL|nr:TrkH family potassium uptake protein [Paenibacillus swuensis]ANE48219.1 ATP synthase subunit J [Paenibacillus swuensis]